MVALAAIVFAIWCAVGPLALAQTRPASDLYRIVVHPTNPQTSIERDQAAQAFLKKVVTWNHGGVIRPVDLRPESSTCARFSEDVLGRSVAAVRSYWLQIIFAGRGVPPPEFGSDDEVIRYVLKEPGAIGYVSNHADLRGAHVLLLQ